MLMRHPQHGWHNASGLEIEAMKKNGWIESSVEEHTRCVAAKLQANNTEFIQDQPTKAKPGRKPKNPH